MTIYHALSCQQLVYLAYLLVSPLVCLLYRLDRTLCLYFNQYVPQYEESLFMPTNSVNLFGTCRFLTTPTSKTSCSFPMTLLTSLTCPFWSSRIIVRSFSSQLKIDVQHRRTQPNRQCQLCLGHKLRSGKYFRITGHSSALTSFHAHHPSNPWNSSSQVWKGSLILLRASEPTFWRFSNQSCFFFRDTKQRTKSGKDCWVVFIYRLEAQLISKAWFCWQFTWFQYRRHQYFLFSTWFIQTLQLKTWIEKWEYPFPVLANFLTFSH